jgi:hypothetical protein
MTSSRVGRCTEAMGEPSRFVSRFRSAANIFDYRFHCSLAVDYDTGSRMLRSQWNLHAALHICRACGHQFVRRGRAWVPFNLGSQRISPPDTQSGPEFPKRHSTQQAFVAEFAQERIPIFALHIFPQTRGLHLRIKLLYH